MPKLIVTREAPVRLQPLNERGSTWMRVEGDRLHVNDSVNSPGRITFARIPHRLTDLVAQIDEAAGQPVTLNGQYNTFWRLTCVDVEAGVVTLEVEEGIQATLPLRGDTTTTISVAKN